MNCPECGGNVLEIRVLFSGTVACAVNAEGTIDVLEPVRLDSKIADNAPCRCSHCDWSGIVVDTRSRPR